MTRAEFRRIRMNQILEFIKIHGRTPSQKKTGECKLYQSMKDYAKIDPGFNALIRPYVSRRRRTDASKGRLRGPNKEFGKDVKLGIDLMESGGAGFY